MVTEENAENMQDVISQHFMQRMDFANPCSMAYYLLLEKYKVAFGVSFN